MTRDFGLWIQGLAEREATLRAQLEATYKDNDLTNRRANLDAIFSELRKVYEEGYRPIREDLEKLNLEKDKWGNFLTEVPGFKIAVPVVLEHLRRPYLPRTRQHLAHDLASPVAKHAWKDLVDLYKNEPTDPSRLYEDAKDGLANALAATVTAATLSELIQIVRDRSHGKSRVLLLPGIRKFRSDLAKQAIDEFANDPDLMIQVAEYKKKDEALRRKRKKELSNV